MEFDGLCHVGKVSLLDGLQVLREPIDFTLENGQATEHKNIRFGVQSRLVQIENVHGVGNTELGK